LTYTTIGYFLLIFFDFCLSFEDDFGLFPAASFTSVLLNSDIIFSASLEFISLEVSLILDFIRLIIFSS